MNLAYAGYRPSEVLAPTADQVDLAARALGFASLKKRRSGVFRAVPVPPPLLEVLELGARHPGAAGPPRQGSWGSPLALEPDDPLAGRARGETGEGRNGGPLVRGKLHRAQRALAARG